MSDSKVNKVWHRSAPCKISFRQIWIHWACPLG